jgi:hypothetical protein
MINALQIIVHMPLMSTTFPANAKFIFSLFIELALFDIVPNEFIVNLMFEVEDTEPYSTRFEELDIF